MKRLNDWLVAEARRQARHPRLEHALLTDRALGYVFYRMQFMWLRVMVRSAVHVLELILLTIAMPQDWLVVFIGYRTSAAVLSSLYWGPLEQLRRIVRSHMHRRQVGSARLEIHNWLRASVVVAALGVLGVGAWIEWLRSPSGGVSLFDVFGIACFVRLGFDLWARTLHSGIFAIKRVYRPLWSLLLPDLIEFVLLVVLFPRLGLLAFLVMVVVGGVARIGLTNHFSKRAYRSSHIVQPTFQEAVVARNTITFATIASAIKFGISNATAQLDGVIILLLLFAGSSGDGQGVTFAGVYYAMRPLMATAHSWARVFYFDFTRMETGSTLFQRRFRSLLTRTALSLACVVALLVLGVTALVTGGAPPLPLLSLVPFFAARSLLSVRQLEAFVSAQHGSLVRVSLGLLVAIGAVAWLWRDEAGVMLAASALLLVAFLMLPTDASAQRMGHVVGLPRWLARLQGEPTPTRIVVLMIDRSLTTASRMVHRLAPLVVSGSITRFGRSHVLVFEHVDGARLGTMSEVALATDGALCGHGDAVGASGREALRAALDNGALPKELSVMLTDGKNIDLVEEYERDHPHGTVVDAVRGRVAQGKRLSVRELRAVMAAIGHQARGSSQRPMHRLDVLVYAPCGEPETIFVTPIDARPSRVFKQHVRAATLRASLRDTPLGPVAQRGP